MRRIARISIITPSFNQGRFIERTIKSVLNQHYSNLEYIVIDGGSTDETIKILEKYSKKRSSKKTNNTPTFIWKSQKDRGQTHAINKGLKMCTGDIIAYLNSDDTYEPNTLQTVADFFASHPKAAFVYGKGRLIDADDKPIGLYNTLPEDHDRLFASCGISQPTCFWKGKLIQDIGYFNESYHYTMDYEYWVRVSKQYTLHFIDKVLANSRIHDSAKTSVFTHKLHEEAVRMSLEQYGKVHYDWVFTLMDSSYKGDRQTKKYYLFMVMNSLFSYFRYNFSLPPKPARKILRSWLESCI